MFSRLISLAHCSRRSVNLHRKFRAYSLSHEIAVKIKGQFVHQQARLITPENAQPTTTYKGLVILAAGPFLRFPTMKKYSDPYLQAGFAAINIAHSKLDFTLCNACTRKVDRILDVLSANITDSCPIVLKLYCSGANSFLPPFMKRVSEADCKFKIAGIIFDSAPVYCNLKTARNVFRLFHEVAQNRNWFQQQRDSFYTVVLGGINFKNKRHYLERFAFNPDSVLCSIPQLYLYSPADYVPFLPYLHKVIDEQRKYGADVSTHVFPDSLHMLHRSKYPEEYDNTVFQFLKEKCGLVV